MSFLKKYFVVITLYTALIACAHTRSEQDVVHANLTTYYSEPADVYLQQAEASPEPTKKAYELKAAGRLIQDDMSERASQIIESIKPQELSPPLRNEQLLLQSQLTLREQKPKDTLALLSQIAEPRTLSSNELNEYHYLLASAYEDSDNYLESAHHYILLNKMNDNKAAKKYYQEKIWDNLSRVEDETLIKLGQRNFGSEINGWLALVAIPKQNPGNWQQMQQALSTWKNRYPDHAGNETINQDRKKSDLLPLPPKQIALLLPLSGEFEGPANAIQDGFMNAYFESQKASINPSVKIYDTSENTISQVYQQAIDEGADFIVGPLDKNQAQAIAKPRVITVPTLALNYIPQNKRHINNFYQFGLSLNDEANQIVDKAWQAGHRKAIIIAPESQWGQEVADFFAQRWFSRGGEVVDQLAYAPSQDLNTSIKRLMHIDRSEMRKEQLSKLIREDIHFVPRKREDVDFIFLVAYPAPARQINPLLKYYYAGETPIYAPSIIYSGSPDAIQDSDLDGIIFSEIPWVLTHMLTSEGTSQQIFNDDNIMGQNPYIRLYALGYDAYQLTYKLNHFILFPELALKGETGMLDLDDQGLLTRKLAWAQFKNGVPQAI